jgi:hypothetical protein
MERSSAAIWAEIEAVLERSRALAEAEAAEATEATPDA